MGGSYNISGLLGPKIYLGRKQKFPQTYFKLNKKNTYTYAPTVHMGHFIQNTDGLIIIFYQSRPRTRNQFQLYFSRPWKIGPVFHPGPRLTP